MFINWNADTAMRKFTWISVVFGALMALVTFVILVMIPAMGFDPYGNHVAISGFYNSNNSIGWWGFVLIAFDSIAIICCLFAIYFAKKTMMFQKLGYIGLVVLAITIVIFMALACTTTITFDAGKYGSEFTNINWLVKVKAGVNPTEGTMTYTGAGLAVLIIGILLLISNGIVWFAAIRKEILMK